MKEKFLVILIFLAILTPCSLNAADLSNGEPATKPTCNEIFREHSAVIWGVLTGAVNSVGHSDSNDGSLFKNFPLCSTAWTVGHQLGENTSTTALKWTTNSTPDENDEPSTIPCQENVDGVPQSDRNSCVSVLLRNVPLIFSMVTLGGAICHMISSEDPMGLTLLNIAKYGYCTGFVLGACHYWNDKIKAEKKSDQAKKEALDPVELPKQASQKSSSDLSSKRRRMIGIKTKIKNLKVYGNYEETNSTRGTQDVSDSRFDVDSSANDEIISAPQAASGFKQPEVPIKPSKKERYERRRLARARREENREKMRAQKRESRKQAGNKSEAFELETMKDEIEVASASDASENLNDEDSGEKIKQPDVSKEFREMAEEKVGVKSFNEAAEDEETKEESANLPYELNAPTRSLIEVLRTGQFQYMKQLIEAGAEIDLMDESGESALTLAKKDDAKKLHKDRSSLVRTLELLVHQRKMEKSLQEDIALERERLSNYYLTKQVKKIHPLALLFYIKNIKRVKTEVKFYTYSDITALFYKTLPRKTAAAISIINKTFEGPCRKRPYVYIPQSKNGEGHNIEEILKIFNV